LTLTYPKFYPHSGKQVKLDLQVILANLRSRSDFEYLWFMEFQERGAPHLHMFTTHDGITPGMRVRMAQWWLNRMVFTGVFGNGVFLENSKVSAAQYEELSREAKKVFWFTMRPETWEIIRDREGAKHYATMYAQKPHQKKVPENFKDCGRFWGCSKAVRMSGGKEIEITEAQVQNFLSMQEHPAAEYGSLPKYVYGVNNVDTLMDPNDLT
jgi:hypothetical protein